MLGDASIQSQNKGKTYSAPQKFEWSEKIESYVDHVYDLFDEWVISPPLRSASGRKQLQKNLEQVLKET